MTDDRAGSAPEPPDEHESGDFAGALQAQIKSARADFETQVASARENLEHQMAHARENFEERNERIKARTGRDLIQAILIGLALGALVVVPLVFFKPGFLLIAFAGVLLGTFELARALQTGGRRVDVIPQLVVSASLLSAAYFGDALLVWVLLFAGVAAIIVWRLISQMAARDGRIYGDVVADVLAGSFLPVYVSFLASLALMVLRDDGGEWWIIMFLAVVVSADTGAYAIGLWLGKHPMAPRVSPKKTWEGFAGAATFAIIAGVLLCWLLLDLPWWTGIICGVALLITATLGDLGESMLKRDLGIKDMSSWIPGHGGVLDRLDSILPSAVTVFALHHVLSPLVGS